MVFAEPRGSGTASQMGRMELANSVGKSIGGRKGMEERERSEEMGNSHVPEGFAFSTDSQTTHGISAGQRTARFVLP